MRKIWCAIEAQMTDGDIPAEYARQVRGEQLHSVRGLLLFGIASSTLNALVVLCFSVATALPLASWIWGSIMLALMTISIPQAISVHRRKMMPRPREAGALRPAFYSALSLGVAWGLGPILLFPGAPALSQTIMTTVCAGMMCGGAYVLSTVPRAAVAFVLSIAIGFACSVLLTGFGFGQMVMTVLVLIYCAILIRAAYWNYTNHVRSWLQQIELNEQKAELSHQNEVISLLLKDFEETASECLWETDRWGRLERLCDRFADHLGYADELMIGADLLAWLERAVPSPEEVTRLRAAIVGEGPFNGISLRIRAKDQIRWLSFSGRPTRTGGMRGIVADVTERTVAAERLEYLAHFDGLTGIPNRAQFNLALQEAVERLKTHKAAFAVMCLDLDRFKSINDIHGHLTGDAALREAARRMKASINDGDVIARFGGDEFAILINDLPNEEAVHHLTKSLASVLSKPIVLENVAVQIGVSMGVAICHEAAETADEVIKRADLALYRAKKTGRGRACFYSSEMDLEAQARRALETDFRRAMQAGEFQLYFQPLIDSRTRAPLAFEALLRWIHPEKGVIGPETFIPVAEHIGLISTLGEWVIREALREAACWVDGQGISVNLSPAQVRSPTLMSTVINSLAATGVDATRLEFEITETALLDASPQTLRVLHELRQLGIRISLDDFGTGYSSLSYLRAFPFDKIKIDKSFVQMIGESEECRAIVRAVSGLAKSLGMRSTAEGVETTTQIDSVLAEGCTELQGFYFSRPRTAEELAQMGVLRRRKVVGYERPEKVCVPVNPAVAQVP